MSDEAAIEEQAESPPVKRKRRWAKRLGWALAIILLPLVLAAAFLSTPIGKRFVTDQIAQVAPASGLRFEVGRIEGDIYGKATLHDVTVFDPVGEFLAIPEVDLNWNPLAWLTTGIDIRELSARRGTLSRLPELLPGDPDAPILPDFDIRVDELTIDSLTLAPGIAGEDAQQVNLSAEADIRSGRVFVDLEGTLGREDRIALLLNAMPDGDEFDIKLDYAAPAAGVIAQMAGLDRGYRARIDGEGTWEKWLGHLLVEEMGGEGPSRVAGFQITNRAGEYSLLGQVSPPITGTGIAARALGDALSLSLVGTLEDSTFDGRFAAATPALFARGQGAVDLADNRFDGFGLSALLRDPALLGSAVSLQNTRLFATLDGPFRELAAEHSLQIGTLVSGDTEVANIVQSGTARYDGAGWSVPLDTTSGGVTTGIAALDPKLTSGILRGGLDWREGRLTSDNLRIAFETLGANLTLRGDTSAGVYALAGPVSARGFDLPDIGSANATAKILLKLGANIPWSLRANFAGELSSIVNETVANAAGGPIKLRGGLSVGGNSPFSFSALEADSVKLSLAADGRVVDGTTSLVGSGRHVDYGDFTIDGAFGGDGPRATLVFADPLPAAGLANVRVAIAPSDNGFAIDTEGGSLLGPFKGALGLALPGDGPARIDISTLKIWRTDVTGALALEERGLSGNLALSGGGIGGTIALVPEGTAQAFDADLTVRGARFGGATTLALASADINANGAFTEGSSRINADISGSGLEYGALFIGRFAGKADVTDGTGKATASIAGQRSDRFALKFDGDIAPRRLALLARGEFAGRDITMPRRAVLTRAEGQEGWSLAPTQVGFGRGYAIVEGALGGAETSVQAKLADMPLSLADLAIADLGFGGVISGLIDYRQRGSAPPSANAKVEIKNFTRSGLVLSSRPVDVLAVLDLKSSRLSGGAVLREEGRRLGRVKADITAVPLNGALMERLRRGKLAADFNYNGPAEGVWRLIGIETFDLTGPATVSSKVTGTLSNPVFNGRVASDNLRVQSALSGTDIANVAVRGQFAGSRLRLTRFAGTTARGGTVSGSGSVNFAGLQSGRPPQIDLRAAVDDARLLNANGLSATLTGPLRIISDGSGGTIAGRLRINRASWALGVAAEDLTLPEVRTREVNTPIDARPRTASASTWRYLVDASTNSRISVDGLGLDSEWGANIALRGTTSDPRIGGEARLVRGAYTFAGTRFDLTRGRIAFDVNQPVNPRLDIEAATSADGVNVTVAIGGNSESPEITFGSNPQLPEEEILARLLFGGSITSLSATDALQLGAALASLRGGGGVDPVSRLRNAIGLDQLRIVSADPALNRGTGVALGKNLGRRVYVEIVTDGRGYSATSVEYRITRWLALLGSVSTIGRQSVVAEISRDY